MNLNPGQEAMANHHSGPLLAIAVAGAGKTTAVVQNLLRKHQNGVRLEDVMVTAFNKDASEEIKKRVKRFYGLVDDCRFGTSHSLFFKILRECGLRIEDLYKEWHAQEALRSVLWPKYINGEDAEVFKAISMLKNSVAYPEDIPGTDCYSNFIALMGPVAEKCEVEPEYLERAFLAYEQDKNSKKAIDMDDMLFKCYIMFMQRPDVLEYYQNKIKHLIVDEYQDTNEVQYRLFKMLAEKSRNIIAVGDDDQAIYGFRGSYPKYIRRFQNDFPEAKMVTMSENYRSQEGVIAMANNTICQNIDRFEKVIMPTKDLVAKPYYAVLQDSEHEADFISETIQHSEFPLEKIAILTRVNMQQALIEQYLAFREIPYNVQDGSSFFQRKEIVTMLAYLKIAAFGVEANMQLVKDIANKPYRRFTADLINSWNDYQEFAAFCNNDARGLGYIEQLEHLESLGKQNDLHEVLEAIINKPIRLGGWANKNASISSDAKPSMIMAHLAKIGGAKSIEEMINVVEKIQAFYKTLKRQKNRVTLTTIHRAKGLEWEEVYVPGCNNELIPHKNNIDIEEERRLFYVAITRARTHLILTAQRNEAPSPFLHSVLDHVDMEQIERQVVLT
jgi:DNA helicase-2/ATP-dependent DNA helicase PcrA